MGRPGKDAIEDQGQASPKGSAEANGLGAYSEGGISWEDQAGWKGKACGSGQPKNPKGHAPSTCRERLGWNAPGGNEAQGQEPGGEDVQAEDVQGEDGRESEDDDSQNVIQGGWEGCRNADSHGKNRSQNASQGCTKGSAQVKAGGNAGFAGERPKNRCQTSGKKASGDKGGGEAGFEEISQ